MRTFRNKLIARAAVGILAVAGSLMNSRPALAQEGGPEVRDLYVVAHQDDDVLFMNPDIQRSIDAGHTVKTVYLTAGANTCTHSTSYYLEREAGAMAAYALMAGVSDYWTLMEDRSVREIKLAGRAHINLVFFRLPIGGIDGSVCTEDGANLRTLWSADAQTITALDGSAVYTKSQLVEALVHLIRQFHPDRIGTLDSSGLNGSGQDPSGTGMVYTDTGLCDFYDNSDHYYSAIFALAAEAAYGRPHFFRRYRGYNIGNEAPNVSGQDLTRKQSVFRAYAEHDVAIPSSHSPFCTGSTAYCLYDNWQERQYRVNINNPPNYLTCSIQH
jgi:hypothetical protein